MNIMDTQTAHNTDMFATDRRQMENALLIYGELSTNLIISSLPQTKSFQIDYFYRNKL